MPLQDLVREIPSKEPPIDTPRAKQPISRVLCARGNFVRPNRSATGGSTCPSPIFDGVLVLERRFASVSHLLRLRTAVRLGRSECGLLSHRHGRTGFKAAFAVDRLALGPSACNGIAAILLEA